MENYLGRLLDNRYEILEVIGTGGMAVVYKALDHRLNRLVAVKILKDEFSRNQEFRRRFHAESQAVAMLSHPNIVSVYDVSRSGDVDYIVMELIEGITLKQYLEKKGCLNWRETLHFAMQIAKALEHAHSRGIVHRDIKPHNIMILKDGSIKVADFGIARIASAQSTLTREALGSVHYISPEQAKGAWVDDRSDLYSLGVVMYEMLTGRTPYDGETPVSVAIQHINGGAPLPSTLVTGIPRGLEQITMHAMASNADERYSSATEMLRDMEEFRKNPSLTFVYGPGGQTLRQAPQAPQQPQQPQYQQPQHQQPQQPQAPKEPSAFGLAIKGLPQLWLSYCKDPIGTTRKAVEKHDFLSGILMAAVTYIAVFFATLVYALRLDSHFPAVAWLGASLLMPVAGFGLTLLTTLVLTKVAKVPSDFKGMLASSGLGMTFPATLAAGSIVLLLVYPGLISLLGVASFAVWAVVTVGTLLQVYGVKLNLVTILLCVAFCIAGYYVVSGLRDWFLHACYSYDINDVLSGLGDLFG